MAFANLFILLFSLLLCAFGLHLVTGILDLPMEGVLHALHLPATSTKVGWIGVAIFTSGIIIIATKLWPR